MGNSSTGRTLLLVCFSTEGQFDDVHTHLANTVVANSSFSPCRCSSSSVWHCVCWLMHLALFVKANIICIIVVSCTSIHMLFFLQVSQAVVFSYQYICYIISQFPEWTFVICVQFLQMGVRRAEAGQRARHSCG